MIQIFLSANTAIWKQTVMGQNYMETLKYLIKLLHFYEMFNLTQGKKIQQVNLKSAKWI